ncbi:TlpA family protein disulfide reductase [Butyricimonas paravirosa]|uniref:TlpA family protein disulfide reductase n=1 Tax=Butyricimonas paravirosa TaxID=1472417 RepID=UPI0021094717|nr:TlpA disulfide reductase family protein [Butyricimonas paravirosa]MCQ4873312.1 TlpA family protein disulfide reductase [Butyricimonas paravirosa]
MKILALVTLLVTFLIGCTPPKENKIRLRGQLADMGSQEVVMEYTGVIGEFGTSKSKVIMTDDSGYFDTTFVLEQPTYFNISRNILYLSPGDDLEVYLTPDTRQATFKGKGREAQLFLKDRLYPKGGSFLLSGRNVKANFEETKKEVDALAVSKLAQLDTLRGVTECFKENERIRVKANLLNSYLTYALYNKENAGTSREEQREWYKCFVTSIAPDVNRLMWDIARNEYLDIIDVRDVIVYNLDQPDFMQGVEITPEMREIKEALQVLSKLDSSTDPEVILTMEKQIKAFQNQEIVTELQEKVRNVKSLMTGQPAHDIIMTDIEGNEVLLSSYKGKNIYLDCWATWCGPCIQESPAFAALKEAYEGKDIVFIQLSTDNSRKMWLNYLEQKESTVLQYNSVDNEGLRVNWQVKYIPRFILIDRDFNIVQSFAPRPSDPEIRKCLDELVVE